MKMTEEKNVEILLSKLDKGRLVDFIRKECMNDRRFRDRFLALGACSLYKPDAEIYASRVEALIEDYSGRHGYIEYRDTFDFNRAVSRILDEADDAMYNGQWEVAIAVLTGVASLSEEILSSGDDSAGELGGIVSECFEKWHELSASPSLPENVKSEIFELALSRFVEENLKGWEWWWDWMALAVNLADTQDKQSEVIKALDAITSDGDDWSTKHNAEMAQRFKLEIMSRRGTPEEQIAFLYSNVSNPEFRKRLLQLAWDKEDYDEVLRLANDGVMHDADYSGLVNDWHKWEYRVYVKTNDWKNQIKSARYFFFERDGLWGDRDFSMESMYAVLKSLIPQNEWTEYVATLISEAQNKRHTVHLLYLYTQEKYWADYMNYIRTNPSTYIIEDAPEEVKQLYPDEIIKLYASEVNSFFRGASNRNAYSQGVDLLRKLIELGGKTEADRIVAAQKARTPRRPALIDELSKL